jgi:hypothetical protein
MITGRNRSGRAENGIGGVVKLLLKAKKDDDAKINNKQPCHGQQRVDTMLW